MPPRIPAPSPTAFSRPPAPFVLPGGGDVNQRLAMIADAINRKADANTPTFAWVKLVAPNGTTYAITVDDGGNLHTTQVLRP